MNVYEILLLKGMIVGILLSLPTGPAGFLSIRQTMVHGYRAGMASALGCMSTDLWASLVTCFGIGTVAGYLLDHRLIIQLLGGVIITGTGVALVLAKKPADRKLEFHPLKKYLATFSLSGFNPMVLVSTGGLFSYFGGRIFLTAAGNEKVFFVEGVVLGGLVWWTLFLAVIRYAVARFEQKSGRELDVLLFNRIFGTVLLLFGLSVFVSLYHDVLFVVTRLVKDFHS